MKNFLCWAFALLFLSTSAYAEIVTVQTEDESGVVCFDLIAGQNIVAGEVCVSMEGDDVCFLYKVYDGWRINETHLWVGLSIGDMPAAKNGNPKIGLFPYGRTARPRLHEKICVPLSDLGLTKEMICEADQQVLFAAHAALSRVVDGEVVQTETGWAEGERIVDKGSWAMFATFTLTCSPEPPVLGECETAFAFGETQLNELPDPACPWMPLTERWGWQIGPVSSCPDHSNDMVYSTPIYAGAGQNDISKGTHVGDLYYFYNGTQVVVTYVMFEGYVMTETHLYVGHENIRTAAPGQFGNTHENLTATTDQFVVEVEQPDVDVYIVAHAVVCEILP